MGGHAFDRDNPIEDPQDCFLPWSPFNRRVLRFESHMMQTLIPLRFLQRIYPSTRGALAVLFAALAGSAVAPGAFADISPAAGMLRYPDVSREHIVFVYAGDIWLAPRTGGTATPLASPPGQEMFPKFSPDGRTIAFMGNYDGNRDIYTIPVSGGTAMRITHHPGSEMLSDWTPDGGGIIYYMSGLGPLRRQTQLFVAPATGGLPTQLPVPYGANGTLSEKDKAGNQWLAYTPHTNDFRTWKRYRGGMATNIWLFNLKDNTSKQITSWEGSDTLPMWHKDKVYYLSDEGPTHRQNIWVYNTKTSHRRQVTKFADFDVKWPSMGPGRRGQGEIIFQNGSALWLLDLDTEEAKTVEITIPGDRPTIRTRQVNAAAFTTNWTISPSAARVAVEARGDIWTLPAERGSPRNLTRSSGIAERDPSWSPDGRWIAYFSDASGEYHLYITQSDGIGATRRLTTEECGPEVFRYNPNWSPDSKRLLFTDKTGTLYMHTLADNGERGTTSVIDRDPWANRLSADWSHDSNWLAYSKQHDDGRHSAIWLYDVESDQRHQVTNGFFHDTAPAFDRKGDYLYFSSRRHFSPTYSDIDTTFIYNGSQVLLAVPLRADMPSPWAPKSDEEDWRKNLKDGQKRDRKESDEDADEDDRDDEADGNGDADDGISGTWEGMATGPSPVPPGGIAFTLTLTLGDDNVLTGNIAAAPVYSGAILDGRYDPAARSMTFNIDAGGEMVAFNLKVENGELSGSATAGGQNFPISARRTGGGGAQQAVAAADEKGDKKEEDKKPLSIDLDGFEGRALQLPVTAGRFGRLGINDKNQLIFARLSPGGGRGGPDDGAGAGIKLFDITDDKREEKTIAAGAINFQLSADGKKILVIRGGRGGSASIQDASAGSTAKRVPTTGMTAHINPREEWKQIFTDAWRIQRDFFYEPGMHGVDWEAMRERYGRMVADAASRDDLSFIISEMISELNVGHAYNSGGDIESGPSVSVGMLGCDYELVDVGGPESGVGGREPVRAYRISRIYQGAAWDSDARGPLSQPGINVREGDYLLAVNGVPVDTSKDPWAAFVGLANRTITITVSDTPHLESVYAGEAEKRGKENGEKENGEKENGDGESRFRGQREVIVQTLASEDDLRYRAWIERNRAYVDEMTSGRVGYIYVPDTGVNGQNNLFRQFYGQVGKEALIIDERWNGGGQIPTRFVELLNRPVINYWARRDGNDWTWPPDAHHGPKVMLINGLAGSGGDAFPAYFRQAGLGQLIGTRTWGGLVGISGNPGLIDGGNMTAPTFGFYKLDGNWGIEGHGVDPDIEVIDDPAKMVGYRERAADPQLDAAIELMMRKVEERPFLRPARPGGPDRSGMGIPEHHR
jgi:tricorn protease